MGTRDKGECGLGAELVLFTSHLRLFYPNTFFRRGCHLGKGSLFLTEGRGNGVNKGLKLWLHSEAEIQGLSVSGGDGEVSPRHRVIIQLWLAIVYKWLISPK